MKINIPLFPTLNENLKNIAQIELSNYDFQYVSNGEKLPLNLKEINIATGRNIQNYNLVDERGEWDTIHFKTYITQDITIHNVACLFGTNGVAADDAKLGIAIMVSSLSSNHRFAISSCVFEKADESICKKLHFEMNEELYREKITVKTVIYLYDVGSGTGYDNPYAKLPGTILGVLRESDVFIDGKGSLFPVKKESNPQKPLWRVQCDWSDPFTDMFCEENVCVILNEVHPNYGLLKIENGMNGSPFLADVIASALQIIITKAIESVGSVEALNDIDNPIPGSIIDAVQYFIKTFGWDPSSPERLAETIRTDFDRRTQNDN